MPRYFMNLRYRPGPKGLSVDEEGDELADETMVREHVLRVARETIARDRLTLVRDWFDCSFEITDEEGRHVMTVPFSDTVPVEEGWD